MTMIKVCKINDITPSTGVCALVNKKQIAIFRTKDNRLYAIDNKDPFSHANVLSRGLIGFTKDEDGNELIYVASPIYKQRFDLATGRCLDDVRVQLNAYNITLDNDNVCVAA